ncbi:hypothetical protein [Streptomyces profundus]|uniref:hypothetical protein n=1 Tax=Streptomyces profundus TaxID=2867410 RepID=UPI001D16C3CB|nr:hypothetical protein [Streptomyces sp. MA3_2.13]UED85582.1 hypothetical protein K4G22_16430 [Streptomyces sp. MA3_2.13]
MRLTRGGRGRRGRPARRTVARLLVLLGCLLTFGVVGPPVASADPVDPDCVDRSPQGRVVVDCSRETPGGPGGPGDEGEGSTGGGGSAEPTCDLTQVAAFIGTDEHFCEGENACFISDPTFLYPDPESWPEEPPREGAVYVYKYCVAPGGAIVFDDYLWRGGEEEGPTLEELAEQAFGQLEAPAFTLAFSPPDETLIFLDTWWWAEGAHDDEIVGTAALGVVAIGTPDRLEVDPGDGSAVLHCRVVTSEGDACVHAFQRSSGEGGYPARARLVYDVRFEQNGEPFEAPALPDTLEGLWQETAVPVDESQAVVVR